ncbi:hypothetical protein FACS1894101_2660 [Betaproteobacteria bacterium]|nr:hypothetical protein FACS1894101_2660 [Betaproteobacteria bacterium]
MELAVHANRNGLVGRAALQQITADVAIRDNADHALIRIDDKGNLQLTRLDTFNRVKDRLVGTYGQFCAW